MNKTNKAVMRGLQELRKGNRAQPIPSGKQYKRKPKHDHNRKQGE